MDFTAFPKIPASALGRATAAPGGRWVALEKIHGAQLVVAADGETVRFGKRKSWLAPTDTFFGWQLLRSGLELSARRVHSALGRPVTLYGELFGGAYPHAEVLAVPGLQAVQTGIWYAPDLRWAVFDMLLDSEFLAWSEVADLARRAELLTPPLVASGTHAALQQVSHRFSTRVPALFGLPTIADNFAEGLVLKPDARERPEARANLKRKIVEFDEARFDDSAPLDADRPLSLAELSALARRFVNASRLQSARSKVGDGSHAALTDEVVLDVLIDLNAAFPRAMASLSPDDEDALAAAIRAAANTL